MTVARRRSGALLLAAGLLLLAACGDGSSSSAAAASTVPPSSDQALKAKAEGAVFTKADFPDVWKQYTDPRDGLATERLWAQVLACLGVDKGKAQGIAVSPTFYLPPATQARSTVEYTSPARAKAVTAALAGPKLERCYTKAVADDARRSAPEGGKVGTVTVAPLTLDVPGKATSATRASFVVDVNGLKVPLVQDLVVVTDGGTLSRLNFLGAGGPFQPALQRSLVDAVVARA